MNVIKEKLENYVGLLEEGLTRQEGKILKEYVEACIGQIKAEIQNMNTVVKS